MAPPIPDLPPPTVPEGAHPSYPTTPAIEDDLQWINAYMYIHVGSDATRRWAYFLWIIIVGIFLLFAILHLTDSRGGYLGAYWNKWALRRRTWRNKLWGSGKPTSLMSNAQILSLTLLTIAVLALSFLGPDYIAPGTGAFKLYRRRPIPKPLIAPFQPHYTIEKAWWTSGNRTGIIAFALFPLCVLFALKAPPFAIFAIPGLVQLHFDKLAWLHRWSGRLIWLMSFLHGVIWAIQLGISKRTETGVIALRYALIYDKFIYACVVRHLLNLFNKKSNSNSLLRLLAP